MEETKIETQSKTYRMPVDVIEILDRWAGETGQTPTTVLTNVLRVAAEDEKRVLQGVNVLQKEVGDVLQGNSVLQIVKPRTRDELADAITVLMQEVSIGDRDRISALGVARARVYKGTAEYQEAQVLRTKSGIPSVYENEKALAERLSEAE